MSRRIHNDILEVGEEGTYLSANAAMSIEDSIELEMVFWQIYDADSVLAFKFLLALTRFCASKDGV